MQKQRLQHIPKFAVALLIAAALTIAACSGGNGGGDKSPAPAPLTGMASLATYVTDNLSTEYAKVWVGIRSIKLVDAQGQSVTVYVPATGKTSTLVNLSDLVNVGSLLSNASVPKGAYTKAIVSLDDAVTLEPVGSGSVINATFGKSGEAYDLEVPLNLTVTDSTSLVLDFDLARFTYVPGTNVVTPTVVQKDKNSVSRFERTKVEFEGVIKSVQTDGVDKIIVVANEKLGDLEVRTHGNATTVFNESNQNAADLNVGDAVEVHGVATVVSGVPVVYASSIEIDDPSAGLVGKIFGSVTAISGNMVTISVVDSNFRQRARTLTVDLGSVNFVRGQFSHIFVGSEIRVAGTVDGNGVLTPVYADVSGGTNAKEIKDHVSVISAFDMEGRVSLVNGEVVTIHVDKVRGDSSAAAGQDITVKIGQAYFRTGGINCLNNSAVRVKGIEDATGRVAREIDVRGGCGLQLNDDGVRVDSPEGSVTAVRASGVIRSIDIGTSALTIDLIEVYGFKPASRVLNVALTNITVTDVSGGVQALNVGDTVEVRGGMNNGALTALRIDRE